MILLNSQRHLIRTFSSLIHDCLREWKALSRKLDEILKPFIKPVVPSHACAIFLGGSRLNVHHFIPHIVTLLAVHTNWVSGFIDGLMATCCVPTVLHM